jgi:hypothetical protein
MAFVMDESVGEMTLSSLSGRFASLVQRVRHADALCVPCFALSWFSLSPTQSLRIRHVKEGSQDGDMEVCLILLRKPSRKINLFERYSQFLRRESVGMNPIIPIETQ